MIKLNTQSGRLLSHFLSGREIDRLSALIELGIFELSSRVIDLQKNGYIIKKERKTIINRFQEKISIVEYRLEV